MKNMYALTLLLIVSTNFVGCQESDEESSSAKPSPMLQPGYESPQLPSEQQRPSEPTPTLPPNNGHQVVCEGPDMVYRGVCSSSDTSNDLWCLVGAVYRIERYLISNTEGEEALSARDALADARKSLNEALDLYSKEKESSSFDSDLTDAELNLSVARQSLEEEKLFEQIQDIIMRVELRIQMWY